jgi:hypothetical protein
MKTHLLAVSCDVNSLFVAKHPRTKTGASEWFENCEMRAFSVWTFGIFGQNSENDFILCGLTSGTREKYF